MATAFPPFRLHSTERVSPSHALRLVSAYLEAATTDPSLHPNALLTENGPVTPASGAVTGLVLHNLKRIEAGLKGEYLAPDLDLDGFEVEALPDSVAQEGGITSLSDPNQARRGVQEVSNLDMDWQDKDEFEREQEIIQGDVGSRNNAVEDEPGLTPPRRPTKVIKSISEKDARREAKRERRKKENAAKLEVKQRQKQAEA